LTLIPVPPWLTGKLDIASIAALTPFGVAANPSSVEETSLDNLVTP